jgi:hypothetical protein
LPKFPGINKSSDGVKADAMMRGLVNVVLVTGIAIAAIAAVVLWPRAFDGILPASMLDRLASVRPAVAPAAEDAPKGDQAADFLNDGPDGLMAEGQIAAMAGNVPVFIEDVITGYSTQMAREVPAEITTIRPIMGCLLTAPLKGSAVGHVVAGQTDLRLGMLTYDDMDLAKAVQGFVDAYRQAATVETVAVAVPDALAYQSHDVVVTEVSAPVYLVLQTGPGNRIWNIHAAPGARIERVVLLGGDQVGVANLDPVVPVEVILEDGLAACGIRPALPLNAGHALAAAAAAGDADAVAKTATRAAAVLAYDQWFLDTFGVSAATSRAGFDQGTVALVGPVPGGEGPDLTPKAVFAGITGSKIRTTRDEFFEISGQVPAGEDFAARVKAIATAFAFGDLGNLRQGAEF